MNNMNELCEKYFWLIDKAINDPNETRVTVKGILAKFAGEVIEPEVKPRTNVSYVQVNPNEEGGAYWECARDFACGLIGTFWHEDAVHNKLMVQDNEQLLSYYMSKNLYRKVETEITWQDEASKFGVIEDSGDVTFNHMLDRDEFICLCHLVASLTDKPKG